MKPALVHLYLNGLSESMGEGKDAQVLFDYRRGAERFARTCREFPPGYEHDVFVVVINGAADDYVRSVYDGIPATFVEYHGPGWDIGACQHVSARLKNDFAVFMTTKTHFKRAGWLARMMEVRERSGDGLYGAMASLEACPLMPELKPNPHIRTAFFGVNPSALALNPRIESRQECFLYESGRWGLTATFLTLKLPVKMVTWDGACDVADCRTPANVFRKGDQSNLIAFDRHTDSYEQGNPEEKVMLERIANGECL